MTVGGRTLHRVAAHVSFELMCVVAAAIIAVALPAAARLRMLLLARAFSAVLTAVSAAVAPDGIRHDLDCFDRRGRIVARNDQLARPGILFRRFVTDNDGQAGARMQRCRERVIDEFPVAALMFERDARNV